MAKTFKEHIIDFCRKQNYPFLDEAGDGFWCLSIGEFLTITEKDVAGIEIYVMNDSVSGIEMEGLPEAWDLFTYVIKELVRLHGIGKLET